MLGVLPYFYFLRLTELALYFTALFKVLALRNSQEATHGWATEGRRYKVDASAMRDVAI
jgi:hypothetical protein